MRVVIGNKLLMLDSTEVKAANRLCTIFLNNAKELAEKKKARSFYFTLLCVMYLTVERRIRAISPEIMAAYINQRHKD